MSEPTHWWQEFFEGLWEEFHLNHMNAQDYDQQVSRMIPLLDVGEGTRLLDIPCGIGGQAVALAERGCDVTGVDLHPGLLKVAGDRAEATGVMLNLVEEDMRSFDGKAAFDAAICLWGSFGYFDETGNRAQLDAVYRSLRPGGRFLLECYPLETIVGHFQPRDWRRGGEVMAVEERSWVASSSTVHSHWTFSGHGRVEEKESHMRMYTVRELSELFRHVGFAQPVFFDSDTLGPWSIQSGGAWVLAAKPEE
ncbi:class I SAM-dependent methyltransferase [bacterium]|nr:class I SAM-dependent methyltransferase [bacterium]